MHQRDQRGVTGSLASLWMAHEPAACVQGVVSVAWASIPRQTWR